MSGYLQRLFDRGAGWGPSATGAAAEVAPAMAPGSPAFAFDQRLAEPGLAGLFGILGLSPELQALPQAELQGEDSAAVAGPARTAVAPVPVLHALQPRDPQMSDRHDELPRHRAESTLTSPMQQERPAPRRAGTAPVRSQPIESSAPRSEPGPATVERPAWLQQRPSARAIAPVMHETRVEPVVVVEKRPADVAPARLDPPATIEVAPASTVQPVLPPTPPPSQFAAQPARAPVREVEPPRRAPQPLAPLAAAATDAREVERIARDAVRAELARRPAVPAPAQSARAAAAASAAEPAPKAAPRSASAREASVIGELEPSSSPLTIYGLRRR